MSNETTIFDRLKNGYEDACKELGVTPATIDNYSHLPADEAEVEFATHKILRFNKAINEGVVFDYNNRNQRKWEILFDLETYGNNPAGSGFALDVVRFAYTYSYVGSRLAFATEEKARFAFEIMQPEYKILIKK